MLYPKTPLSVTTTTQKIYSPTDWTSVLDVYIIFIYDIQKLLQRNYVSWFLLWDICAYRLTHYFWNSETSIFHSEELKFRPWVIMFWSFSSSNLFWCFSFNLAIVWVQKLNHAFHAFFTYYYCPWTIGWCCSPRTHQSSNIVDHRFLLFFLFRVTSRPFRFFIIYFLVHFFIIYLSSPYIVYIFDHAVCMLSQSREINYYYYY